MNRLVRWAGYGALAVGAGSGASAYNALTTSAAPLPSCVGTHVAPVDCASTAHIDGVLVTAHLTVSRRGAAHVGFTLNHPRSARSPIAVRWHVGRTSDISAQASGAIPAGRVSGALDLPRALPCDGQLDVKFLFTAPGGTRGRIVGPMISVPSCAPVETTTTAPPTTTVATTLPGTTEATPSSATTPSPSSVPGSGPETTTFEQRLRAICVAAATSVPEDTLCASPPLPGTGSNTRKPVGMALGASALGAALILIDRKARKQRVRS